MTTSAMTWRAGIAALALVAASCGGGPRKETTPAGGDGEPVAHAGGEIVPPEQMDEINRSLERKRSAMSRCLSIAVDNKELPKGSAGRITLEIIIAPGGRADTVKVVRSTLDSRALTDCVVAKVKEIQFPALAHPYETSYTYGFESM